MKFAALLLVSVAGNQAKVTPIEKTVQLLFDLQAKISKEAEGAQKLYEEFTDYCDDQAKELTYAIKTGKAEAERLEATIAQMAANIQAADASIEQLTAAISVNEQDLKGATEIREKEAKDFGAADADLGQTVDMLRRAVGIIEREMNKGSSLVQADWSVVTSALQTLLDSQQVSSLNKKKVQSLLQDDDSQPGGAPDPAAYASHSGSIVSTLEDMLEKAAAQQAQGQKDEMTAKHNFELLAQHLKDELADQNSNLKGVKKQKASAAETKATAEGELAETKKGLGEDEKNLADLQKNCMEKASEYDAEKRGRAEELEALDAATKILQESTGPAAGRAYSFIQVGFQTALKQHLQQEKEVQIVNALNALAKGVQGSTELVQLALKVKTEISSADLEGDDPFAKVKGLIQDMIEKLVNDAAKEASHKAFCDKELAETKAKREDREDEIDTISTRIDQATSKIAKLKEDVARLEGELASIAKVQAEADALRAKEKAAWAEAKTDYTAGVEGVRMALQVLREYYAEKGDDAALLQSAQPAGHSKATGASTGIIGLLEVIESDFSKLLAEGNAAEEQAQTEYDQLTQDNEVATQTKRTEVEYKTKDSKETAARLSDLQDDLGGVQKEHDAIMEYWQKLQPMCIAKPEPYAERKKRREAEISGLKEALTILENESAGAFLQIKRSKFLSLDHPLRTA